MHFLIVQNSRPLGIITPFPVRSPDSAKDEDRGFSGLSPLVHARWVPPNFPLTCPMELWRLPPAPVPPAPASQLQDLFVQAISPLPKSSPGLPSSPEVFHLTSAFAASQMLKIPRHLSPGAYQGPEERGEDTGRDSRF